VTEKLLEDHAPLWGPCEHFFEKQITSTGYDKNEVKNCHFYKKTTTFCIYSLDECYMKGYLLPDHNSIFQRKTSGDSVKNPTKAQNPLDLPDHDHYSSGGKLCFPWFVNEGQAFKWR
jgi:hypothetical protein